MSVRTLALPTDSAGHKMTTKVPLVHSDQSISEVRLMLMESTDKFDTINYIYVVSKKDRLKGVVTIKDILTKNPNDKIRKVMKKRLVKVRVDENQIIAARLAVKNNIKAMPLVDKNDMFMGVLPSDEIHNILDHESREDLLKSSGIILGKHKLLSGSIVDSPFHSYLHRVPWILVGLFGSLVTAKVIGRFEGTLETNLILASFIPLVAYLANAVGNQTQMIFIRDLATQPKFSMTSYAAKSYLVSSLIVITCWILITAITYLLWGMLYLGFMVGLSVFIAALTATTFALLIPRVLVHFDIDPASGSGPFSTVIQDLLSIVIYLTTASLLI